jgi:hypothetical protein
MEDDASMPMAITLRGNERLGSSLSKIDRSSTITLKQGATISAREN